MIVDALVMMRKRVSGCIMADKFADQLWVETSVSNFVSRDLSLDLSPFNLVKIPFRYSYDFFEPTSPDSGYGSPKRGLSL
jgi:hypothetical protein